MRTLKFLLIKEFKQIFRNRAILAVIMVMPVIQLLILPLAANYDVRNINLAVIDNDRSGDSAKLIDKIVSSGYFRLAGYSTSYSEAYRLIQTDDADLILEIPSNFEKDLITQSSPKLFIAINAINGVKAGLGAGYIREIIQQYSGETGVRNRPDLFNASPAIQVQSSNWYNPFLNYRVFMVPGILAVLVSLVGGFLSALNIVKEREAGTIEQINVSPVKKHVFILGKLIPFWLLGITVFSIGLAVSWGVYGIVPEGSLLLLYSFVMVYLLAILGFGLLISTFCETQQQAMLIMFFFLMIFILMGGLFTSIDSMPDWAKTVSMYNPVSYLIEVVRMVVIKGSGLNDISRHIGIIVCFAIGLNTAAVLNYSKMV